MRIIGVLSLLVLLPLPGSAQRLSSPSPHFGALSIPNSTVNGYLGLSFDRFTPNGKATDPGIYNGIDRTIGLNFLNYSFASRSVRWPRVIYRGTVQLGYGHDQPTESIQRNLHLAVDSLPVESINPRSSPDFVVDFEADYWAPMGANGEAFAGAGFAFGTPNQDVWLHTGGVQRLGASPSWPTLSGVARLGFPRGGDAFPDSTLTNAYVAVQGAIRLPLSAWFWRHLPDLVLQLGRDSGFFAHRDGTGIGEKLGSISLHWPNDAFVFEFWNDYFGGDFKDKGPTGGGRIYVRVPSWSSLLGWLP